MTIKTTAPEFYGLVLNAGFPANIAKLITAQAAHETAIAGVPFMSPIYLANHNAFGMKNAGQSLVTGENMGHAVYATVEHSILDYQKWYNRRTPWFALLPFLATTDSFVSWLKKHNYFEASEAAYLKGVNHFYTQIFG